MRQHQPPLDDTGNWLAYDGQCPFCSGYIRRVRLQQAVGPVALVDMRKPSPARSELVKQGCDLDRGMVLKLDGRYYQGDDCLNRLALLSTRSGLFNRINAALFRHAALSRLIYPGLRGGRRIALAVLGRGKINDSTPGTD
ncbi:MAG: DCC1-like thiol-disulfide oxidoreductase family protein [Porticoccaceae bacterium]